MASTTSVIREDAQWILDESGLPLERLRGRTLLLTGACGFLGAYVLDVLACWTALGGEPLVLLSYGRATRSFCYLWDATCAMLLIGLVGRPGEAYNMGNDRDEASMLHLAETLREVAAMAPPVQYRASDHVHYLTDNPQRRCPDLAKLRALGPFDPRVPLWEGLSRTFRSYSEDQR